MSDLKSRSGVHRASGFPFSPGSHRAQGSLKLPSVSILLTDFSLCVCLCVSPICLSQSLVLSCFPTSFPGEQSWGGWAVGKGPRPVLTKDNEVRKELEPRPGADSPSLPALGAPFPADPRHALNARRPLLPMPVLGDPASARAGKPPRLTFPPPSS